ncbi:MAG: hypothetical protein A2622_08275 [Bdellovibrionales bacterium RIFCSPHIGHO2_01_FULL_40_29]|nr:MAG: hypothetical protein A2622_08275 [Bdellovibrionales bacterium RIFCSPHIGHO2_01_FULL_40_29]OFZ35491.1 MAG: hypothetical protein A3D17_07510 [Bdellovibrionales bacterium RIFCSPHIGHO2_02_FULL_40_15]
MNSANFKLAKSFTRGFLFSFCFFAQVTVHAWEIDLSRRQTKPTQIENVRMPASQSLNVKNVEKTTDQEIMEALKNVVNPADISREIVIVNTDAGFVPDTVQVKKGEAYKIHVVNLNMKEKNTSFLMDSFTQSHNTMYGNLKTFVIEPKVEGVFSYQCPETGVHGKLVVVPDVTVRKTASEE